MFITSSCIDRVRQIDSQTETGTKKGREIKRHTQKTHTGSVSRSITVSDAD